MPCLSVSWVSPINLSVDASKKSSEPTSFRVIHFTELLPSRQLLYPLPKMQFTLITSVLVACMTVFVSASPIPAPQQVEVPGLMAREIEIDVARSPVAEADPEPACSKYACI